MIIGVVGLGLIGGSMAKAVKAYTGHQVWGMDRNAEVQQLALTEGVLDGILDETALARCDLLLLALYPQATIDYVERHAEQIAPGACVTDLCGVKHMICKALVPLAQQHGFYFVGGHPMAGKERSGYAAAQADLFSGASMILTPEAETPAEVMDTLESFFTSIGFSKLCLTEPPAHDRMIAYTSQLAHVLSSAYVKSPAAVQHRGFSAGSFQDMTRVATLNETMWTELCIANRDYLTEEIYALCDRLKAYADALHAADAEGFYELLREGCAWKAKTLKE